MEGFVPRGDFRCLLSDLRECRIVGLMGRKLREGLEERFDFDFGYSVSGRDYYIC